METKRYVERYINGKPTKSKKKFADTYTYAIIPYSVDNLKVLLELNLYFDIVDVFVTKYKTYNIEVRIYKPKSYLLVAYLYHFFKEHNIDNFKVFEYNKRRSTYTLIDTATVKNKLFKGYIR